MMPRRKDVFTGRFITETEYQRQAAAILEAAGDLDERGRFLLRKIGRDAEELWRSLAPEQSGRMSRGIKAVQRGDTIEVTVEAVDPETGFDYVEVTRYGHDVEYIFPIDKKVLKTKIPKPPGPYFAYVKGYDPKFDWAEPAYEELDLMIEEALEEFGEDVMQDIGRNSSV